MSTETTNKKIKIDNGTTFGKTYTDKAIDAKLPTDIIASAKKLSLGIGSTALGNGVNLDGFTYDEATKTLKAVGQEIKTISITEILDTKYVNEIYGYLTDSSASVGKKYPLLKDITDIIDNYDTIFITTNAVGLEGGLLFRKQLNGLPTTFSLTYGYFSFIAGDPGVNVIDFSTICVSLTNDTFWLGTISSGHLLPKYDDTMNGKVLSVVGGKAQWANAGGGGDAFDVITLSDDGTTYTGIATGTKPLILKTDWAFIVPKKYTYIEGLINSCEVIDNNKVTTYSFNNGKYTSKFSFIFYTHFITLTNSTDSIYIQYQTSDPDYKEPLDMTHLKRVLSGKKALCSGVLGNSAETSARPLYVAGNSQLTVYYVLNSDTNGTISEKSIENYTISDVVTPVD